MSGMTSKEFARMRQRLHLSQEALAAELGVSQQAVSHWELGRNPIPRSIEKLMYVLVATSNHRENQ